MTAERGAPGTWQHLAYWERGQIALGRTAAEMPVSDVTAARAIAAEHEGLLHFRHISGWHVWDGRCHAPDHGSALTRIVTGWADRAQAVFDHARQQVHARLALDGHEPGAAMERAFAAEWEPFAAAQKYAAGLHRNAGRTALESTLAALLRVPESSMDERAPYLLNVANGTVDLRTGQMRPHDPRDLITYCLPTPYVPGAQCPRFLALLHGLCGHDRDVTWYLARLLGYALVGANPDQVCVFLSGPSNNGKSTVMHIVSEVLGELAHESQATLITVSKHGRNARVENSIRGRRFITISETSGHMSIEEGQLKRITGDPVISVDQHYAKEELRTPVTWLIVVVTNEMPALASFDDAVRRRVIVIPGGPPVPPEARDKHLAARILAEESEGILALLVQACAAWSRDGLGPAPAAVAAATRGYEAEQDTVTAWLSDCCEFSANGHLAFVGQSAAWQGYQQWSRGSARVTRNEFYARLAKIPGVTRNEISRRYEGIAWKPGSDPTLFG